MNCPLETPETAGVLLEYCSRSLAAESSAVIERHIAVCPKCRDFALKQQAVWSALDAWEAPAVTSDFDRRLYERIEREPALPWRDRVSAFLRPLFAYRGIPAAAAACLVLTAGLLLERSTNSVPPPQAPESAVVVEVQAEQVEKALDAMDVLSEFNRKVRTENPESKL